MIREKDLEKTKFFTTDGTDMWRVKSVSTVTLVELVNCETGGHASARVGEGSAGGFMAVKMPKVKGKGTGDRGRVTVKKKPGRQKKKAGADKGSADSKSGRGVRKGKPVTSKYFGVSIDKWAKKKKFRAQVSRGGEYKYLGNFAVEEEAAAAVQEHLANLEEAARLRLLNEQKDRQRCDETMNKSEWMCHGCGASYDEKPENCTKCGSGAFQKSRPEDNHK